MSIQLLRLYYNLNVIKRFSYFLKNFLDNFAIIHYYIHMKTITINVSEPIYSDFKKYAKDADRTTSEIIREAMADYHAKKIKPRKNILEIKTVSLGKIKTGLDMAEIAEEMHN